MSAMYMTLWLVAGLLAGAWYIWFASKSHAGRERKAYANGLLIAAAIYPLFALIWGDAAWIGIEALGIVGYGGFVWLGRRYSFYFIAVGWLLHPLWDVALHLRGPGRHVVPDWYAIACVSFDLLLSLVIARRISVGWRRAPGSPSTSDAGLVTGARQEG